MGETAARVGVRTTKINWATKAGAKRSWSGLKYHNTGDFLFNIKINFAKIESNMGLELRPSIEIRPETKLRLSPEQRQQLEQVISLQLKLKHPEFPDAARGLEGMMDADAILKEKNVLGVLVGSLSVDIWRKKVSQEKFRNHKDVDVMVVSPEANFSQFEGGVDWWLPQRIEDASGWPKVVSYRWVNGNDVQLRFGALYQKPHATLPDPAGLYLPGPKYVVEITKLTLLEKFKEEYPEQVIDAEVSEEIEKSLRKMFTAKTWDAYPESGALSAAIKEKFDESRVLCGYNMWRLGHPRTIAKFSGLRYTPGRNAI